MNILGIDPGASGGLAIVTTKVIRPPRIEHGMRMPLTSHRGKKLVDAKAVFKWLHTHEDHGIIIDVAVCEWVHAMPRQGVSSSFSFGRSTGAVEAIASLYAERMVWVTPVAWKKHFGLSKDKQASIDAARHYFGRSYHWERKADEGIAEAALMAQWYVDKNG